MAKKTTPVVTAGKLAASVALPASTGDGVVHEIDAADLARTGEHPNDDIAGDLAAAEVTRPVVAVGAVVEPVNPALASEPAITGDAAGDAAIEAAGAGAEFVQPLAVDISTLRPDTFSQSAFLAGSAFENSTDNPARSTTTVEVGAGDPASPAAALVTGIDWASGPDEQVDYIVFDMSRPATQEDRDNLLLVLKHLEVGPGELMEAGALAEDERRSYSADDVAKLFSLNRTGRFYIRIASKVAGFRRAGIAHPAEAVEYPVDRFTPEQIETLLAEPNLVAEII